MDYFAFLDESGDLGRKFDHPYQVGGSSRYFTIGLVLAHKADRHRPARVIKSLREKLEKKYEPGARSFDDKEIKASHLTTDDRSLFCKILCKEFLKSSHGLRFFSITVNKTNVRHNAFKNDGNILYNYMTGLCLLPLIKDFDNVALWADQRKTAVRALRCFDEYLITTLAGNHSSDANLSVLHKGSHTSKEVQCADILCNIVWRSHEYKVKHEMEIVGSHTSCSTLFF